MARPRIAILGRFAEHTSVTRFAGVVNARRLLELVWEAGDDDRRIINVVKKSAGRA